jgi:hypothetical protein
MAKATPFRTVITSGPMIDPAGAETQTNFTAGPLWATLLHSLNICNKFEPYEINTIYYRFDDLNLFLQPGFKIGENA